MEHIPNATYRKKTLKNLVLGAMGYCRHVCSNHASSASQEALHIKRSAREVDATETMRKKAIAS
eukprot:3636572-Amphidinium_carterae.1